MRTATIILGSCFLLSARALATDLTPEDYQAALAEANSIITGLTTRAQQLAIQIAQQNREIARLKASAEGATKTAPKSTEPSHP